MVRGQKESARPEQRPILGTAAPVVEVHDADGNIVHIPLSELRRVDGVTPQPDPDGSIPEFVNVSGKVQRMIIMDQPHDTIPVQPFGVLKGAQWRMYSEEGSRIPPYIERRRQKNGEYDSEYLLEEDQILGYFNPDRSLAGTGSLSPWFAPRHMEMFLNHAKLQTYDSRGEPQRDPVEIEERRPNILRELRRQISELNKERERRFNIMTKGEGF
jgi:hypothetical protein